MILGILSEPRRIHRDLIGDRPERRQHACAVHHQSTAGLPHRPQRGTFFQLVMRSDVTAALQVDQRVGEHQVVLADELIVAPHVGAELRPSASPIVCGGAPCCERYVHEVRRAPHHPASGARPVQHHDPAGYEFLMGAWLDE